MSSRATNALMSRFTTSHVTRSSRHARTQRAQRTSRLQARLGPVRQLLQDVPEVLPSRMAAPTLVQAVGLLEREKDVDMSQAMKPRDLDPHALEAAQNAVLLADGWERDVIARERSHAHPFPQVVKVCEDVERGILAYLTASKPAPRMTEKATRQIEDSFRNDVEAHKLLGLINAEFQSDPMSVQCFDLRIVERVKLCVARRDEYLKAHPEAAE